jgi:hypothetical protein
MKILDNARVLPLGFSLGALLFCLSSAGCGVDCEIESPEDFSVMHHSCLTVYVSNWASDELSLVSKNPDSELFVARTSVGEPVDLGIRRIIAQGFFRVTAEPTEYAEIRDVVTARTTSAPEMVIEPRPFQASACAHSSYPETATGSALVSVVPRSGGSLRLESNHEQPCLSMGLVGGTGNEWLTFSLDIAPDAQPNEIVGLPFSTGLSLAHLKEFGARMREIRTSAFPVELLEDYSLWLFQEGFSGNILICAESLQDPCENYSPSATAAQQEKGVEDT